MIPLTADILTLRDIAALFREAPATTRAKIAQREKAGFPKPLPRVATREPFKWPADEVRAWMALNRGRAAPAPANDRTSPAPSDPDRARRNLLSRL